MLEKAKLLFKYVLSDVLLKNTCFSFFLDLLLS